MNDSGEASGVPRWFWVCAVLALVWNLIGAAAFLDVGRAWFEDRDNGPNGGVLANVGFGLRFNSSRAEKSSVIHIDLAYPLVKEDDVDIDNSQFLITVKDSF